MVTEKTVRPPAITEKQVLDYLKANPKLIADHPEIFEFMMPPAADHGDGVLDMQQFMVRRLQQNVGSLKNRYDGLIDAARDNLSVQHQVHNAVLDLIKARDLTQMLQVMTMDLVSLFDVDVVRLGLESEMADQYDTYYSEQNYSGIVFIEPGTVSAAMGKEKAIRLIEDTDKVPVPGFGQIFADCSALVKSCALLRLQLPTVKRAALLTFGVRHANRFHPGQGVEMLAFLAQIVEHCLDKCLNDSDMMPPA